MTQLLNLGQARVVDPILTTIVQGYTNGELVGNFLFPVVPVEVSGGKVIQFGKEAFQLYDTQRAPGGRAARINAGYQGVPYALENHGLDAQVPDEISRDAQRVPGIDLAKVYIKTVQDSLGLGVEVAQATMARDATKYDANHKLALAGTAKWSDPSSDPAANVNAGREAIRASTGRYPNTLLLSAMAFTALRFHPKILEKFKYTSSASITEDMLAKYFNVDRVVVGGAVKADDKGNFTDVWGADAVLAYVPIRAGNLSEATKVGATIQQPSYGYTYTMRGHPNVEQPYRDNPSRSWVYGLNWERAPVLSGITSGFLFQTVA
ncbi:hypothetical protein OR16_31719 [Cupriavidus basilensis OR16]|uniref:Major capsid protein n=1 Tax=Cupriavidus basilensis OR16 TaxID=1127483 RepID=H1SDG7_9BURK|nr:major capsid protein [Cupriavidus basilensis]EHP39421.1 hypothetical protein OR16_31719 [Cupriavidus basilensis OR16]